MLTPRAHTHATQESDRELSELQLQLATGAEERGQLQAALAAAQDRQREAEGLSAELTAALQQHKAAVAALQQDKAELVRQLARCTPGEFDRLHAELMAAKRHASELVVVQEALERTRAHLSDAEGRLADQQVGAGCLCCSVLRQPCCCWHGGMLMSDHASPPLAHPYTHPPTHTPGQPRPPPPPHTHTFAHVGCCSAHAGGGGRLACQPGGTAGQHPQRAGRATEAAQAAAGAAGQRTGRCQGGCVLQACARLLVFASTYMHTSRQHALTSTRTRLARRLQVKAAMVNSAQAAVAQLKEELREVTADADEARRAAEDAMAAAARASDAAAREAGALRCVRCAGLVACACLSAAPPSRKTDHPTCLRATTRIHTRIPRTQG
jgi:hypothetical protein